MTTQSSKNSAKTTPPQWEQFTDARENQNAGKYPNYWVRKTRSGHTMIFDDSEGAEHVTIQHRNGSMIQFMPDGAVQYVSHNGQQNIIFGENRVVVTGAQDTTVRGDASTKVDGDDNRTVKGGSYSAVAGPMVQVAESSNQFYEKQMDIMAKSGAMSFNEGLTLSAGGVATVESQGAVTFTADSGASLHGKTGAGIKGEGGGVSIEGGTQVSIHKPPVFAADADLIFFNCGKSKPISKTVTFQNPNPTTLSSATDTAGIQGGAGTQSGTG